MRSKFNFIAKKTSRQYFFTFLKLDPQFSLFGKNKLFFLFVYESYKSGLTINSLYKNIRLFTCTKDRNFCLKSGGRS